MCMCVEVENYILMKLVSNKKFVSPVPTEMIRLNKSCKLSIYVNHIYLHSNT